ncbi:MAG: hypothetical protein ACTSVV_11270, partial [Promethearchaeota archaeon]
DLNQGTMKLLFGESTDVTFIVINDYSREIFFLLNCHQESHKVITKLMTLPFGDQATRSRINILSQWN